MAACKDFSSCLKVKCGADLFTACAIVNKKRENYLKTCNAMYVPVVRKFVMSRVNNNFLQLH